MIRQGRGKEPAGLRLFPKGDKYGHSDSIIRSSRIVWGAYSIRPYRQGWRLVFLSPFLSLMKEKEAKENQGVRDAGQIYRVLAGAAYALCPLTVLCDPLYKCAGRLRVLVGWGRGVMGRVWGLNDLHIIY